MPTRSSAHAFFQLFFPNVKSAPAIPYPPGTDFGQQPDAFPYSSSVFRDIVAAQPGCPFTLSTDSEASNFAGWNNGDVEIVCDWLRGTMNLTIPAQAKRISSSEPAAILYRSYIKTTLWPSKRMTAKIDDILKAHGRDVTTLMRSFGKVRSAQVCSY
jgi:hypothetical protein